MNNSEQSSSSEKSMKQTFGKRKSDYPLEMGITSKKQKITSSRSISMTPINYISNSSEQLSRISQKPLTIKTTKITSTSVTKKSSNSVSNLVNNQSNKTKTKFTEGCLSNSLHANLRKILEQEKNLDSNLKKLTTLNEDTKIKVLNEFIRKNLELFESEGLNKMLHNFKKMNEEKKTVLGDINAKSQALKETVEINLIKSRDAIEQLKTKKMHLDSKIRIKNEEIKVEEEKHKNLLQREKELSDMKTNISFDVLKTEEEIKIIERKQKLLNLDLEKNLAKKEEYYKNKMESVSQILVLKPFYKKFCIIRDVKESLIKNKMNKFLPTNNSINSTNDSDANISQTIKINKNRKNLHLINEDIQFKFDFLISLLDNPYEEIYYTKENNYLNEELISIFMSYLIRMNQISDERDFIVLYISDNLKINSNLFLILQEIANRISHYNDYFFNIKITSKKEFKDVTKEISFNHNHKLNLNLKDVEKNINNILTEENEDFIFCFNIQNKQNKSKLKIFNLSFDNLNYSTQLLNYFNDYNSKKKRERSSKKRKTGKDIVYILDQMELYNGFFYMTVIDCSYDKFSPKVNENLKEILLNLN